MGIFDFLKKLSTREEEIRDIKLEEVIPFIDSLSQKIVKNVDLELVEIKEKIIKEKEEMKENLQKLSEANIKNPNFPERAKQIAEGNRKICILKINTFLKEINPPKNFNESLDFNESFDKNLQILNKGTMKSYRILPEFYPDEITLISKNMNNFDDLVKKIKKLVDNEEIEKYNKLKDKVNEIQEEIKQQEEIKKKIELIEIELSIQTKEINKKESKIKELEEKEEHKKFLELVNKKEALELKTKEIEKQPINYFYNVKSALKKYERLTLDYTLINEYIDDPLKALLKDKELKILEHIDKIKEFIIKEKFELKEKKKIGILKELDQLTKSNFEAFLNKYHELNKELDEIKLEISKIEIVNEIKKTKEEFNQDKNKLEEDKVNIENMKEKLKIVDIDSLKSVLKDELKVRVV